MIPLIRSEFVVFNDGCRQLVDYMIVFLTPPNIPQPDHQHQQAIKNRFNDVNGIEYEYITLID